MRREIANGQAGGPLVEMPTDGLQVGADEGGAVRNYKAPNKFTGEIKDVVVELVDKRWHLRIRRALPGNYRKWTVITADGLMLTGLLVAEPRTTVHLLDAEGKSHTIDRSDIEELIRSKLSLMPSGIKKDLKPKDFAALLEFLALSKEGGGK